MFLFKLSFVNHFSQLATTNDLTNLAFFLYPFSMRSSLTALLLWLVLPLLSCHRTFPALVKQCGGVVNQRKSPTMLLSYSVLPSLQEGFLSPSLEVVRFDDGVHFPIWTQQSFDSILDLLISSPHRNFIFASRTAFFPKRKRHTKQKKFHLKPRCPSI